MSVISIIVPIYNAEKTLVRCIESILAQEFSNFELIIIDDGSTDASGAICDEYAKKDFRIRVIHKQNGGVSSARNQGIDNAKGEWITFCDADDYVYPCWLTNFIDNSQDADLVVQGIIADGNLYDFSKKGDRIIGIDFIGDSIVCIEKLFEKGILGYPWNKLFRRYIIAQNNLHFDSSIHLKEDEIFVLQYLKYCRVIQSTSKAGYYYEVPDWTRKYKLTIQERLLQTKTTFRLL